MDGGSLPSAELSPEADSCRQIPARWRSARRWPKQAASSMMGNAVHRAASGASVTDFLDGCQQNPDGTNSMTFACRLLLPGLLLAWAAVGQAQPVEPRAGSPDGIEPATVREVEHALTALDSESFATRGKAVRRLEQWVDDPRLARFLADRFSQVLHAADTSFEVRACVEILIKRLPVAPPLGAGKPAASEIAPLLDQLNGDSSAERASARQRLTAMLDHVELIGPLWQELKRRAQDPALTTAGRRELEPLLDQARGAWLLADPAAVPLPAVSRDQIVRWVEELTRPEESNSQNRFRRDLAERELLDALARDDARGEVLQVLEEKIAGAGDGATGATLRQIADFARPAMAAEVWGHELENWEHRQHKTVQYLIVGLPQFNEMAQRATHFDRIDEQTAHCVTGNTLTEGDYPVRIAIPHPDPAQDVMYYLTNLPTPRRRLAYEYQVRRDEALRLREISQRTLDDFLKHQRVLGETQVALLAQLDSQVVSRFAGAYFRTVPDRRLVTSNSEFSRQSTVHRGICYMLIRVGTRECVPALEELARSGRIEPTYESPYQIAWIAALAIAQRDPWPGVDRWLAQWVDQKTLLVTGVESPPELGASAAALLLDRRGASTRPFGLETTGESTTEGLRFVGYRFAFDRGRQDVIRWWEKQKYVQGREATP